MKNKGFTLIELLGVIIILSIIMLIAIPNVTSTLENSKRTTYITDAKKMITQTEYALRTNIEKPNSNEILKVTLADLGTNDIEKDPDGDAYDLENSYVIVARVDGFLTYYVNLVVDKGDGKLKGISLTSEESLDELEKSALVVNNLTLLTNNQIKQKICSSCTLITVN